MENGHKNESTKNGVCLGNLGTGFKVVENRVLCELRIELVGGLASGIWR